MSYLPTYRKLARDLEQLRTGYTEQDLITMKNPQVFMQNGNLAFAKAPLSPGLRLDAAIHALRAAEAEVKEAREALNKWKAEIFSMEQVLAHLLIQLTVEEQSELVQERLSKE